MFSVSSHGLMSYFADNRIKVLYDVDSLLAQYFHRKDVSPSVMSSISLDPLQEKIVGLCLQ
jgi:hypothetical protein